MFITQHTTSSPFPLSTEFLIQPCLSSLIFRIKPILEASTTNLCSLFVLQNGPCTSEWTPHLGEVHFSSFFPKIFSHRDSHYISSCTPAFPTMWNTERSIYSPGLDPLVHCGPSLVLTLFFFFLFSFSFWLCPQRVENPRHTSNPQALQWQCQILNPLCYKGTPPLLTFNDGLLPLEDFMHVVFLSRNIHSLFCLTAMMTQIFQVQITYYFLGATFPSSQARRNLFPCYTLLWYLFFFFCFWMHSQDMEVLSSQDRDWIWAIVATHATAETTWDPQPTTLGRGRNYDTSLLLWLSI